MNLRLVSAAILGLALTTVAYAQDASAPPSGNQTPGMMSGDGLGPPAGPGMGPRGMGMMGRGISGTVTAAAPDHFTIKTFRGDSYTVAFSANTHFMKQPPGMGRNWRRRAEDGEGARDSGMRPQPIQGGDIKVGDPIAAMGETDIQAKTVGAVGIVLLDPERARQMQQMEADYGKTWLMGRVTAIDGVKITLMGSVDEQPHTIVADENTDFLERRQPITLADIHVGDMLRAEGALKAGDFTASRVNEMRVPPNGRMGGPPPQ